MSFNPYARRAAAVAALGAAGLVGLATAASAHVTVNPDAAEQGSWAKVSFRVPNERDDAATTRLQIDLPAEHPLRSVSVRPVPGWDVETEKTKLPEPVKTESGTITEAVTRITWTGGKIEPGRFQEFDVSFGPLPADADRMMFKAAQTYEGGEVVDWDEPTPEGGAEPEHPAPVLALTPAGSGSGHGRDADAKLTATGGTSGGAAEASDGTARLLGGVGIGAGVVGIAVGGVGLARARSRA
ncbi:YcnI family copper-binding membrane protein [Actinomadura sediminis]|uniref:YcnI family protein n=1 Tax=Actinomadura sediminis TaxID=1038904 RepID=A0ABW3EFE0_9ACTN